MTSGQYSFGRRSYRGRIHRMQGCILNTKDATELKTCKKNIFLVVPSPGDDKNLAGLASFDFRIL